MALRGLLLLATTGLFIATWQGDSLHQRRTLAERELRRQYDVAGSCGYVATWLPRRTPVPVLTCSAPGRSLSKPWPIHEARWFEPCIEGEMLDAEPVSLEVAPAADRIPLSEHELFVACEPPLPAGIVPGEYRVVSSRGEMFPLTLTTAEIAYHGLTSAEAGHDLYTIEEHGCRWYFIRVAGNRVPTFPTESIEEPAIAEKPAEGLNLPSITTCLRCDVQMAAWCSEEACHRWSRRITAWLHQNDWAEQMTESLRHALERIRQVERISETDTGGPRL